MREQIWKRCPEKVVATVSGGCAGSIEQLWLSYQNLEGCACARILTTFHILREATIGLIRWLKLVSMEKTPTTQQLQL